MPKFIPGLGDQAWFAIIHAWEASTPRNPVVGLNTDTTLATVRLSERENVSTTETTDSLNSPGTLGGATP